MSGLQVPDVPDVQQVEAPMAVDDPEPRSPRRFQLPGKLLKREDLGERHRVDS